jgi:hypothetical protein
MTYRRGNSEDSKLFGQSSCLCITTAIFFLVPGVVVLSSLLVSEGPDMRPRGSVD